MPDADGLGPLEGLEICPDCRKLRGPCSPVSVQGQTVMQECDCERRARGPLPEEQRRAELWGNLDFNTAVELCRCCGLVPLRSGSRWSVWLCEDCKQRVRALNRRFGRAIVPIGRHSVMNGISLQASAAKEDEEAIEEFVDSANGLFQRIGALEEWARERVAYNIHRLGRDDCGPVLLTEYLEEIAASRDPDISSEATFRSLLRRLRVIQPVVEQAP